MSRARDIFCCLTDTLVAPAPPLPAVRDTDVAAAFDRVLAAAPRRNALGLRAALHALELAPRALGHGARLRTLEPAERLRFLQRLDETPLRPLLYALRGLAQMAYYGSDPAARVVGYDADAVVARARALRTAEGRW